MKAENRKYSITYHDGSKEIIIGTHNLPPQSQVRSVRLIKDPNPSQNAKNGSERLSERKYIVKYPDGTETLITGFHNLPDKTSVSAIYRVREDAPNTADTASEYLCFADFEYTCGGMANDIDFDAAYGQEILSVGLVVALRATGEAVDTFYQTIRPVHNRQLTGFCKNLTGLTQEEIDASDDFETVMKQAASFCKQYDFAHIYVFGNGDKQTLLKDQKRHQPVPGLTSFVSMLKSVDSTLSQMLFHSSLPISLENLKRICELDSHVAHHALSDARDLCSVWFCVTGETYNKACALQYQQERLRKAEYYRSRQFAALRLPEGSISPEKTVQKEKAITSALEVIAYLKETNQAQPFVSDMKLSAFCDDLLTLLGASDEHFDVQKKQKE